MENLVGNVVLALTPVQRSVRDHFQTGGAVGAALLAMVLLVCVVWLTYRLSERLRRARQRCIHPDDPRTLFHDLLGKLDLTGKQRRFLRGVADVSSLKHPATLLLSEIVYDRCVEQSSSRSARVDQEAKTMAVRMRGVLFPGVREGLASPAC